MGPESGCNDTREKIHERTCNGSREPGSMGLSRTECCIAAMGPGPEFKVGWEGRYLQRYWPLGRVYVGISDHTTLKALSLSAVRMSQSSTS